MERQITDLDVAKKLVAIELSATSRGKDFDLSLKTIRRLLKAKNCFFTGVEMNDQHGHQNQRTLDRLDNEKGYVEGNLVACTKKVNNLKGSLSVQDIINLYKGLKKKKLV
jgi:hypothetical protein